MLVLLLERYNYAFVISHLIKLHNIFKQFIVKLIYFIYLWR